LEGVLRWNASTYLCTLLGCHGDLFHVNMGNMDSHDANIVLEGNGALDIHEDAHVITYLQACKILVELTPKECD